jgi:NADH/NAD ratio-sensing transcriptional regulator Rex
MGKQEIPDIVIQRLPVNLQALNQLLREGRGVVSSAELGHIVDVSAAQNRKDLSLFWGIRQTGQWNITLSV